MTATSFEWLSERAQVVRMRRVATDALRAYPITATRLRLLNHGFNTTFRVDTADGQRFALRINLNSRRTAQNLRAESAWLAALANDTDLHVPVPQQTVDGGLVHQATAPGFDRPLPVVLMSWLPGGDLGRDAPPDRWAAVGRATATLHAHGAGWRLPADAELPRYRDALAGDARHFDNDHPLLDDAAREVFGEVIRRNDAAFAAIERAAPLQPVHADLHGWNLKWCRGRLSIFDFDDSAWASPALDVPVSAFYVRPRADCEQALLDGYAAVRPLPEIGDEHFEAIVAGRNLLLVNDMFVTTNAAWIGWAPQYVRNSIRKLRAYLDTGRYRHDIEGLEPAR